MKKTCNSCKYIHFDIEKGYWCKYRLTHGFKGREVDPDGVCPLWKTWKGDTNE